MNYKVNKIMPVESGVSQTTGNKWVSQTIVVEENTPNIQYPNKYVLQLMNDKVNMRRHCVRATSWKWDFIPQ